MTGIDFNQSEQHHLSIRLSADGFSFSTRLPNNRMTEYTHTASFLVDPSCSMTANLKSMIASNEVLKAKYQQVNILVNTHRYTTIPFELYEDEHMESLFYHNFTKVDNEIVLCNILGKTNTVMLFGMDKYAYQLLNEQYPEARFFASASPLTEYFAQEDLLFNGRRLYVHLCKNAMDIFAFDRNRLMLLNTFACRKTPDFVYYLLYVWQQLGFNPENDKLVLTGDNQRKETLSDELCKYLRNITSHFNQPDENITFDLQILQTCE